MAQTFQMFQVPPPPPPPPQGPPPQNGNQAAQQYENVIGPEHFYYSRWWRWFLVVPSFYFCFVSTLLTTFSEPPPIPLYVKIPIIGFASLPFLIDIGVSVFAYWDKFAVATVNDRRRIVINAALIIILRLGLIVPFEVVGTHPIFRMLALVFRFFYSTRIHRLFSELDENISFTALTVVGIAKIMWVCFLVCHYGGCVFYIMATFHDDVNDTWFSLVDLNFTKLGLIKKYVTSMYYAVISFTTVGYGDLHPIYIDEKIFSVIFLLVNFGLVVYVGTTIVYLVSPDSGPLGKYRARRMRVLNFCRQNGLSDELYDEVSSTLKTEYRLQSQPSEENGILESLPTTVKRKILAVLSNGVKNTILFNHLSNPIQFQLIEAMEHVLFQDNTHVILKNEVPTFLYFVVKGSVELIFSEDSLPTVVGPGNIFGETCVLFNTPQIITATTRAFTQLLRLDRVKLLSILEVCVNDASRMINHYIENFNVNNNEYMKQVLLDFEKRAKTVGRVDLPLSLWFAVRRRYNRLFDLLVERYPDPNECDEFGQTAMHLAASSGDVQKVIKLLEIGADPNIKDLDGNVPLSIALSNGHANVVQALKNKRVVQEGEESSAAAEARVTQLRGSTSAAPNVQPRDSTSVEPTTQHGGLSSASTPATQHGDSGSASTPATQHGDSDSAATTVAQPSGSISATPAAQHGGPNSAPASLAQPESATSSPPDVQPRGSASSAPW